jgi:hypothetical protein
VHSFPADVSDHNQRVSLVAAGISRKTPMMNSSLRPSTAKMAAGSPAFRKLLAEDVARWKAQPIELRRRGDVREDLTPDAVHLNAQRLSTGRRSVSRTSA